MEGREDKAGEDQQPVGDVYEQRDQHKTATEEMFTLEWHQIEA